MKVISLFNLKGGVGKTVSSVNIATLLALKGKKVLLVDNDPQANSCINLEVADETQIGIYELLSIKELTVKEVIKKTKVENLDIIPSTIKYFNMQNKVSTELNPYNLLRKKLDEVRADYDYIIIDNHPSLSVMSINGLVASDEVLVPITPDNFALEGLSFLFDKLNEIIEELNYDLKIGGVFITRYKAQTNISKEIKTYLENELETQLLTTVIRDTTKVGESTTGEPLVIYDKNCTASKDYVKLVREIFNV
ncbi:MAG: ParA family protein [Clostridium sp.]